MDSGERGMDPVAMTIINPRKEYWPSRGLNQRPVLKSAKLPTEVWGSAIKSKGFSNKVISVISFVLRENTLTSSVSTGEPFSMESEKMKMFF